MIRAGDLQTDSQLPNVSPPVGYFLAIRDHRRNSRFGRSHIRHLRKGGFLRHGIGKVQKTVKIGEAAQLSHFLATHQTGLGNRTVGLSQPHPDDHVSVFVHLEPPVCHFVSLLTCAKCDSLNRQKIHNDERNARDPSTAASPGAIMAIFTWLHYGDPQMAPYTRSLSQDDEAGSGSTGTGES